MQEETFYSTFGLEPIGYVLPYIFTMMRWYHHGSASIRVDSGCCFRFLCKRSDSVLFIGRPIIYHLHKNMTPGHTLAAPKEKKCRILVSKIPVVTGSPKWFAVKSTNGNYIEVIHSTGIVPRSTAVTQPLVLQNTQPNTHKNTETNNMYILNFLYVTSQSQRCIRN